MNPTTTPASAAAVPAIFAAHGLLTRMLAAAQRASDAGREFLVTGARNLVGLAIKERNESAATVRQIGAQCGTAQQLLDQSLSDGVIDPREARALRAALGKPQRTAEALAANLSAEVTP